MLQVVLLAVHHLSVVLEVHAETSLVDVSDSDDELVLSAVRATT